MLLPASGRIVEFCGGPLDGLVEDYQPPLERTLVVRGTGLAVKPPFIVRVLRQLLRHPKRNSVAVAIYELQMTEESLRYQFVRSGITCGTGGRAPCLMICEQTIQLRRDTTVQRVD